MSRTTVAMLEQRVDALDAKIDAILAAVTTAPAPTPASPAPAPTTLEARRAARTKELFAAKYHTPKAQREAWRTSLGFVKGETIAQFVARTVQ